MDNIERDLNPFVQFEQWLGEQPFWLNDAAYRIYHNLPIDDNQIDKYVELCIAQVKGEPAQYKVLSKGESVSQDKPKQLAVCKLFGVEGVNAIANNAELEFSETGITTVYGLNGAGKSGFMRIFKRLCGSPYEEVIQPNVFKKESSANPKCNITLLENGTTRDLLCDLSTEKKVTPLVDCDVFDTPISSGYILHQQEASYQPFVFGVLSTLSQIADRIGKVIEKKTNTVGETEIQIPETFQNRNDAEWMLPLKATSSIPETYEEWPEAMQKQRENLLAKLNEDQVKSRLGLEKMKLSQITPICDSLESTRKTIESESFSALEKSYCETQKRYQAAQIAFAETADEIDQASVDSEDWTALWKIAKRYYESTQFLHSGGAFGAEGSKCPLCHQALSVKHHLRFDSVNEFVNGTCSEEYETAKSRLYSQLQSISQRMIWDERMDPSLVSFLGENLVTRIKNACVDFRVNPKEELEVQYSRFRAVEITSILDELLCIKDKIHNEIDSLESTLNDEERKKLQNQLESLEFHKWVFEQKELIKSVIEHIKMQEDLARAKKLVTTNKITAESNWLAGELLSKAYIDRFTRELRQLAPKVKVRLEKGTSKKGSSPFKISIDTDFEGKFKTEDVLSEGEQRIVSLAAFFADATGRDSQTPIIIDDPISSLDYNYEEAATKRIVQLAKDRQVIVFTHRISLLAGISNLCEENGVQYSERRIRSGVKGKGIPDFEGDYYGRILGQLKEILSARIPRIRNLLPDSEERLDAIGRLCQQFRICVERTVEDELLFGMVRRFSRRIKTDGLIYNLTQITRDDCKMIDDMMSKYSYEEHSQPAETPMSYFELDEIEKDVQNFTTWLEAYRKRK